MPTFTTFLHLFRSRPRSQSHQLARMRKLFLTHRDAGHSSLSTLSVIPMIQISTPPVSSVSSLVNFLAVTKVNREGPNRLLLETTHLSILTD